MQHYNATTNELGNSLTSTNETAPAISTPSIASSAMLVELSISTWTGRKLDKRASTDVTRTNGADSGIANVHKKLLGNSEELTAIQKLTGNIRNMH